MSQMLFKTPLRLQVEAECMAQNDKGVDEDHLEHLFRRINGNELPVNRRKPRDVLYKHIKNRWTATNESPARLITRNRTEVAASEESEASCPSA